MSDRFPTIVVDPPWEYREGFPVGSQMAQAARAVEAAGGEFDWNRRTPLPYAQMTVEAIAALPVRDLAERDAHLYLWTTNRYLDDAFDVLRAWGFRYSQTLLWVKTPMGQGPGGTWAQNVEYVLFGRRGSLKSLRRFDSCWFNWPRMGKAHSRKPDAFIDMVEEASPGPYLKMFARRARLGDWSYWGDESLQTAEVAA